MIQPKRSARYRRYREIAQTLSRHGFGWLLAEGGMEERFGLKHRWNGHDNEDRHTRPWHARRALEELGATFIKFGQLLSTRPGMVPPEYAAELSKLQDDAPQVPYAEVAEVIASELGAPPEEIFLCFDPCPRAAASIGQVHAARLHDGAPVIVKVQRPGVAAQCEEDLAIMREMARLLSRHTRLGAQYALEEWIEEFASTLHGELDYTREARHAGHFRRNWARDPDLYIPRVYWEYTTRRVLTMEEVPGISVRDTDALEAAGVDCHWVAETCARIAMVQIFEHGFFHADPHPGNFFVMPDGAIGLIDFGMVGRLNDSSRAALLRIGLAVIRKDADGLIDELLASGVARGQIERPALRRDLERLIQQYSDQPMGETCATHVVHDVAAIALRHRLRLPSDFALLVRVIAMCEGLGARLDPGLKLHEVARPYIQRFWLRARTPDAMARRWLEAAEDLAELAPDLPRRLRQLLGQWERGEVTVTGRLADSERMLQRLERAANRVAMSVLAAGLMIGLSLLISADPTTHLVGWGNHLLWVVPGLAAAMVLSLLAMLWRSGR